MCLSVFFQFLTEISEILMERVYMDLNNRRTLIASLECMFAKTLKILTLNREEDKEVRKLFDVLVTFLKEQHTPEQEKHHEQQRIEFENTSLKELLNLLQHASAQRADWSKETEIPPRKRQRGSKV